MFYLTKSRKSSTFLMSEYDSTPGNFKSSHGNGIWRISKRIREWWRKDTCIIRTITHAPNRNPPPPHLYQHFLVYKKLGLERPKFYETGSGGLRHINPKKPVSCKFKKLDSWSTLHEIHNIRINPEVPNVIYWNWDFPKLLRNFSPNPLSISFIQKAFKTDISILGSHKKA